ncbi:hypothetical protein GF412_01380 [Candidatus Micrarchaeota archaeon]|nr:hypothetical protein [Candidatus Micrarchaeota archaeon]MBD3417623.1 hypothetical protein [Candidatus Micrarchaeota archaeon]
MDKDTPVGTRERTSSIPPKTNVILLRPVRSALGAQRIRRPLPIEGAKHLGQVERIEEGPLKEYKKLSIELERALDEIISGSEKPVRAKKRSGPRPSAIEGASVPHTGKVSIRKEEIISKLRAVRERFCIDLEERRATTLINNMDKGCPASINPGDPDFSKPSVMEAVLVVLRQARDFAKEIWESEEYTRVDEKLELYDGLVSRIIATEDALSEQESLARKKIVLKGRPGGAKIGRKELMELFRSTMLGEIKQNEEGEEMYHTPETSDYMWKAGQVDEAIEFARDVLATLETGARMIYAKRREPFSVVGEDEKNGA